MQSSIVRSQRLIVTLCLTITTVQLAYADSKAIKRHVKAAQKAEEAGDWQTAAIEYEIALGHRPEGWESSSDSLAPAVDTLWVQEAEKRADFFSILAGLQRSYFTLASDAYKNGQFEEAEKLFEREVRIEEPFWERTRMSAWGLCDNYARLAEVKFRLKKYSESERLWRRVLMLAEEETPLHAPIRAWSGVALGTCYLAGKKYYEAEPVFLSAVESADSCRMWGHTIDRFGIEVSGWSLGSEGRCHLAEVYREMDEPEKAESLYAEALTLMESAPIALPIPRTDSMMTNYVMMLRAAGREDEAQAVDRRAWQVIERRMRASDSAAAPGK